MNEPALNRRQMCRLLGGTAGLSSSVALACGMRSPAAERGKPFALRYVLASSMYGKMKLREILPEVRKTAAESIDLWPQGHADQREQMEAMGHRRFGQLLRQHGVRLGMTTRYDLGPFGRSTTPALPRSSCTRSLAASP